MGAQKYNKASTRKRRMERQAAAKAARTAQDYDADPPTCANCVECKKPSMEHGLYVQPFCGIGKFAVTMKGNCAVWEGADGEKLR